jgi:hypothetical protein
VLIIAGFRLNFFPGVPQDKASRKVAVHNLRDTAQVSLGEVVPLETIIKICGTLTNSELKA